MDDLDYWEGCPHGVMEGMCYDCHPNINRAEYERRTAATLADILRSLPANPQPYTMLIERLYNPERYLALPAALQTLARRTRGRRLLDRVGFRPL
jgi:hypothetical protein